MAKRERAVLTGAAVVLASLACNPRHVAENNGEQSTAIDTATDVQRADSSFVSAEPHGRPCVQPGADSAAIVAAAKVAGREAHQDTADILRLRVVEFQRQRGGTLVKLFPGVVAVGGGAVVWVPDGGCAVVRELLE